MKNKKSHTTRKKLLCGKTLNNQRYYFLNQILEKNPDYIEALEIMGDLCTKSGDFETVFAIDMRLAFLQPLEAIHYYNLACDCALLGKKDEALMYLNIAIILGYRDFKHLNEDPDLASIREDERYEKLINGISCRRIK